MAEMFKVNAPVRKPLFEGVQGENEARSIVFDITPWVEELGDGAVTATAKRSQDSQPYPVTVTKDGTTVTWKPTSTDTAFAGVGSFQLEYTVDSVLAKTCIWSTMVAPSLDPAGDPPDPYDNWLAEMRQVAADAIQAAADAEESAQEAESYTLRAFITKTASGEVANFADGADDVPMKSLKVAIVPKQAGSGDPSPSNVRAITGTSTANAFVTGKNLFGGEYAVKYDLFIPAGQAVTVSAHKTGSANLFFAVYDQSGSVIDCWTVTNTNGTRNYRTFTFTYDVYGVRFYNSASDNMQIELGSTPTDYAPYTGHTTPVPLGQTVYGGTLDVTTGVLTIDMASVNMGSLAWGYDSNQKIFYTTTSLNNAKKPASNVEIMKEIAPCYRTVGWYSATVASNDFVVTIYANGQGWVKDSRYTTSSAFKTAMNGVMLVYELETPTTVQLTPAEVRTLLGTNNIWADCGSVEVEYRADPTLAYAELQALILENL